VEIVPGISGVYFVQILGDTLVSVNADRPKISERSIKVNSNNCKYGRAANLARRQRDYQKTFGAERVKFTVLVVSDDFHTLEQRLNRHFIRFRMKGAKGHLNEWLEGVDPETALSEALQLCNGPSIASATMIKNRPSAHATVPVGEPEFSRITRIIGGPHMHSYLSPDRVVKCLEYLQAKGMSVEFLRDMHHSPARKETFTAAIRYFGKGQALGATNTVYAERLNFVVGQHKSTGESFRGLVGQAIKKFPHS
jgi:hypothetical protein